MVHAKSCTLTHCGGHTSKVASHLQATWISRPQLKSRSSKFGLNCCRKMNLVCWICMHNINQASGCLSLRPGAYSVLAINTHIELLLHLFLDLKSTLLADPQPRWRQHRRHASKVQTACHLERHVGQRRSDRCSFLSMLNSALALTKTCWQ